MRNIEMQFLGIYPNQPLVGFVYLLITQKAIDHKRRFYLCTSEMQINLVFADFMFHCFILLLVFSIPLFIYYIGFRFILSIYVGDKDHIYTTSRGIHRETTAGIKGAIIWKPELTLIMHVMR